MCPLRHTTKWSACTIQQNMYTEAVYILSSNKCREHILVQIASANKPLVVAQLMSATCIIILQDSDSVWVYTSSLMFSANKCSPCTVLM